MLEASGYPHLLGVEAHRTAALAGGVAAPVLGAEADAVLDGGAAGCEDAGAEGLAEVGEAVGVGDDGTSGGSLGRRERHHGVQFESDLAGAHQVRPATWVEPGADGLAVAHPAPAGTEGTLAAAAIGTITGVMSALMARARQPERMPRPRRR